MKQRNQFFREYRDHSKVLAKVILEGFGNDSGIFGLCKYDNGKLQRNNPKIPEIENIGLAREHLKNGYVGIWSKKEEAEKVAVGAYDNIENLINQYEKIVSDSIPRSFFIARNDGYSPDTPDFLNFYHKNLFNMLLFNEITYRLQGKTILSPAVYEENIKTKDNKGYETSVRKHLLLHRGSRIAVGDEQSIKYLLEIFDSLVSKQSVEEIVKKYYELKNKIDMNTTIDNFYIEIQAICRKISQEGDVLLGKCKLCPKKNFFDYLKHVCKI